MNTKQNDISVSITLGPWRVGDAGKTVFGPPNGSPSPETIASVRRKANARLIASAPALLSALRGMLEWARRVKVANPGHEVVAACNAIETATGGAAVHLVPASAPETAGVSGVLVVVQRPDGSVVSRECYADSSMADELRKAADRAGFTVTEIPLAVCLEASRKDSARKSALVEVDHALTWAEMSQDVRNRLTRISNILEGAPES